MPEVLGPFRAALVATLRRRATWMLLFAAAILFVATAYGSYSTLRSQRHLLVQIHEGTVQIPFGIACGLPGCRFIGPDGRPAGPLVSQQDVSVLEPGAQPGQQPGSQPVDPVVMQRITAKYRPVVESIQQRYIREIEAEMSPRRIFPQRARSMGSLWGIAIATLFASTIFGAEWRWGLWRTQSMHEPRRGRVYLGKLLALWTVVAVGFFVVALLTAGGDAVARTTQHVVARGGPSIASVAARSSRPLLGVELYATLAAAFAVVLRSSLAGFGGTLVGLLGDGLLTRRFQGLRVFLPTQQIARLLPSPARFVDVGAPWWPLITSKVSCPTNECRTIMLTPIPLWRAMVVLGTWLIAAGVLSWAVLRLRDI